MPLDLLLVLLVMFAPVLIGIIINISILWDLHR